MVHGARRTALIVSYIIERKFEFFQAAGCKILHLRAARPEMCWLVIPPSSGLCMSL